MWRNLKVSGKLSLGFGFILLVFVVAVLFMRGNISTVQSTSSLLANGVAVASELINELNVQAYELFMAERQLQFTETPEAVKAYEAQLGTVLKIQAEVEALHKTQPALVAPAHVVNKALPLGQEYVGIVARQVSMIESKRGALATIRREGQSNTATISEFMASLHTHMKKRIQDGADPAEISILTDAMALGDNLMENSMALRRDIWQFIASFGADGAVSRAIADRSENMRQQVERLDSLIAVFPEGKAKIDDLLAGLANYESHVDGFVKICGEVHKLNDARSAVYAKFNSEMRDASKMVAARVKTVSGENVTELEGALLIMYISAGAAIIFGVLVVFFITRSIARPLNNIARLARRAGDGDLTVSKADFEYDGMDEMGSMITALSDMLESQRSILEHLMHIAGAMSTDAGDLSATSADTHGAMDEVRAAISEITALSETNGAALEESNAGVEEMSAGADTVAQSATDSAAFISQTTDVSQKAVRTVNNVIEGMRNVNKNSKASEAKTRELFTSVENVSSFVAVITGIADQTNLLALNAAIEAARAGEAGRGFAVVAEEVRKLAEESARAAQSVNGIIQELQNGAQASIDATSEAGRLLVTTLEHAEQAVKELDGALDQMQKANDSIQNIAAVAEEQAASSKEVATAIDSATKSSVEMVEAISHINKAADHTSASTEKIAKEADEFTMLANDLLDSVAKFRVFTNGELADAILGKIQAHKDFKTKLFTMAETCEPVPIQINPRNCGLGVLMHSATPPEGHEYWWDEIHEPHDKFHELGAKIIEVVNDRGKSIAERRSEAMKLAREGDALSKTVIKLLEDAAADIRGTQPALKQGKGKIKALPAKKH